MNSEEAGKYCFIVFGLVLFFARWIKLILTSLLDLKRNGFPEKKEDVYIGFAVLGFFVFLDSLLTTLPVLLLCLFYPKWISDFYSPGFIVLLATIAAFCTLFLNLLVGKRFTKVPKLLSMSFGISFMLLIFGIIFLLK